MISSLDRKEKMVDYFRREMTESREVNNHTNIQILYHECLYRNISKYSRNKLLLTWDLKQIKHFGYSLYMNHVFRANRSSVIWAHRSFYVSERAIRLGIKRWKNCLKKLSITNEKKKILTNRSFFERFARITSELLTSLFFKEIESDSRTVAFM